MRNYAQYAGIMKKNTVTKNILYTGESRYLAVQKLLFSSYKNVFEKAKKILGLYLGCLNIICRDDLISLFSKKCQHFKTFIVKPGVLLDF